MDWEVVGGMVEWEKVVVSVSVEELIGWVDEMRVLVVRIG